MAQNEHEHVFPFTIYDLRITNYELWLVFTIYESLFVYKTPQSYYIFFKPANFFFIFARKIVYIKK